MKVTSLTRAFAETGCINNRIVHTGQHYDERLSRVFFDELDIPAPDVNLEVGSGSHAAQTAEIMKRFEPVLLEDRPDWLVVVGDVNSTLACALVASKLGVRIAHVEAGLRSFDRSMPEEINRVLTDAISDLLFVSESSGLDNLRREGVPDDKVYFVGNVMIDTLLAHRNKADRSDILQQLNLSAGQYVVVTLHRPANVDRPAVFTSIIEALARISDDMPVVFPMHPRTRNNLARTGLDSRIADVPNLQVIEPLSYLDFLKLMAEAGLMMTDSGGIQEETAILDVPCFTLRPNTERPATIDCGTNQLVRPEADAIVNAYETFHKSPPYRSRIPQRWDGQAARRITEVLLNEGM